MAAFKAGLEKAFKKADTQKDLEKLSKTIKKLVQENNDDIKFKKELLDLEEKQYKLTSDYIKAVSKTTEKIQEFGTSLFGSKVAGSALAQQYKEGKESLKGFIKAGYEGSGSIGDFTKSFDNFLGPVGSVFNYVGQSAQTNVEAFRLLSQVGATFGSSIVTLREAAFDAALPLSDFADLVGKNSENLSALFGSTTRGAQEFARLANTFRQNNIEAFAPLGFTVSELNEVLLTQFTLLRRTNNFERLSNTQRLQSARNLAVELDKLARITGQSRSQLAEQIEAQLSNEKFLAFIGGQSAEAGQRLSAFAATVRGLAPDLAEGFQDLIANSGVPVTEAARELIMNIPEASSIIRDLTSGATNSQQALVALQGAAQRSNQALRGITQTGTVGFTRLQGAVNQLASRQFDLSKLSAEELKKREATTKALTQFEDASKRVSAGFQSIETGFFAALGGLIGDTGSGLNKAADSFARGIQSLTNTEKALLFVAGGLGDYLTDSGKRIAEITLGTAAGFRLAGGALGLGGFGRNMGVLGRGYSTAAGVGMMAGGTAMSGSQDPGTKLGGAALGALGGALTGAQLGAMAGTPGMLVGGLLGAILGGAGSLALGQALGKDGKKAMGGATVAGGSYLVGERGPELFTPSTSGLVTSKSQIVSNDTTAINNAFDRFTSDLGSKIDSMVSAVNKTNSLNEQAVKALNTQVALTAQGNKISDKTRKGVASMGSLV